MSLPLSTQEVLEKLKAGEEVSVCDIYGSGQMEGQRGQEARLAALIAWVTNSAGSDSTDALLTQILAQAVLNSGTIFSVNNRQKVEPLGMLGVSRVLSITASNLEVSLTTTCRRARFTAQTADARINIGTGTIVPATSTSHLLLAGTSMDVAVPPDAWVSVRRDATTNGQLAISELTEP